MKKYLSRVIAAFLALTLLATPASALTVDQALELLEENYYFDIPEQAYEAATLEELLQFLGDPYTEYMSAEQYAAFVDLVESTVDMVGVGVVINFTDQGILIREVLSGGSALEAGLQPGDLIVAIDGTSCVPAGEEQRDLMLGEEGTKVTVTVLRDGETHDYTLTRRPVHIPNTEITLLEGGVGYVDCNSFGTDTGELFTQGLKEYDDQVDYWLVDLRDNVGGYADAAADMLAALSGPGRYIYFEYKDGQVGYYGRTTQTVSDKPVLLLVNDSSASASEALAAGVRDLERGIVIGSRTFGKGVGQNVFDESSDPTYFDGDCLKITTGRFYSAKGNTTDKIGVIPTLLVDDGYTEAVALALTGGDRNNAKLCLIPDSVPFYVDPDTPDDVLRVLLEAIPPQMPVFYSAAPGAVFNQYTPAEIAEKLGLELESRWFSDVEDSPYAFAINAMGAYRLLNGTSSGVFGPEGQLTRAQLCVMLARVLNVTSAGFDRFSDVDGRAWYAGGVNAMAELGLVNGVGGGKFDPDSPVTQEQFLTIMGRTARYINFALDAYGLQVEEHANSLPMDMRQGLASFSDWAKSDVSVLAWGLQDTMDARGDMLYTALKNIDPSAPILREEAAAGVYAVLKGLDILP